MIERRYGICRTVFLIGPYAVKVPRWRLPRNRDGIKMTRQRERVWAWSRAVQANLSEQQWSNVTGVAPVLHSWLGGIVNVYPRCEPWPTDGPEPDYDAIGVSWMPRDRKPENIGLLDGTPVWLDYDGSWNGCPHSRDVADLATEEDAA